MVSAFSNGAAVVVVVVGDSSCRSGCGGTVNGVKIDDGFCDNKRSLCHCFHHCYRICHRLYGCFL